MANTIIESVLNALITKHNNIQLLSEASEFYEWKRSNPDKVVNCIGLSTEGQSNAHISIDTIRMLVEAGLEIIVCNHDEFYEYLQVKSVAG